VNNDNKRIARNTLMLYFRMILLMGVSLYTSRIVLEVLGVEDFGIYNIVGGIVVMFGFLNTAMSTATQRFLSFELGQRNKELLKKVFSSSLLIHFIIAFIVFIVSETFGLWFLNTKLSIPLDRMNAANWVYQFSIFSFIISIMSVPYNAAIISHERMNVYAYVSIIEAVLKLLVVYLLGLLGFDKLKIYACLLFLVSLFVRVIYQVYCRKKFEECSFNFIWDKELLIRLTSFSGWSLFGGIAYVAKSQGINILLNIFYGATVNAAWAISQQVNSAVLSFMQNFTTALNPPIVKAYANKNLIGVFTLLFEGMKYSFFLAYCLIIPLFFELEYVMALWLKSVPEYAVIFVRLVLVCILMESFAHVISVTVQATGKIKWFQIIIGGIYFLNLPLSYWFLRVTNSPVSTMYVAVFLSALLVLLRFCILFKLIHFPIYRLFKLIRLIVLLCFFTLPIISCLQIFPVGFIRLLLTFFSNGILALLVLFFFGMSKMERDNVYKQIRSLINLVKK
jgi:O-antigen/teichoic acid export membrane protein